MKKYLLLIPTLFVMLLNVIGCGQVVYASDSVVDYSHYFVDPPSDIIEYMDFTDILEINIFDFPDFSKYYYQVYADSLSYENYCNGISDTINISFLICDFTNSDSFTINEFTTMTTTAIEYRLYHTYYTRNTGYSISSTQSNSMYFYFTPDSGAWGYNTSVFTGINYVVKPNHFTMYVECELFNFGNGSSGELKVEVEFDPLLSGTVDRNVSGSLVSSFKMNITNNSKSPIQYRMAIFEGNVSSFDSCFSPYNSSNCIFVYMTHDWIYCKDVTKMRSLTATDNLLLQNVGTSWHYLEGKSSFSQTFNYSQINFSKDKTYSVVVEAGLTDLDHSSGYFVENIGSLKRVENRDKENLKYILDYSTFSTVFSSTFIFDSLKGISYDSSDNSFGIIANSSSDDYTYAIHDRQAFYDENGNLDFIGYNPFDDEDSYVYNPLIKSPDEWKDENNILYDDSSSLGSIYSSIGFSSSDFSFGSGFSNFGSMLGSVFNIFPSNFWKMFTAGFISIIVIAIVKAVK